MGERFGVAESTILNCTRKCVKAILAFNQLDEIVSWPSAQAANATERFFSEKTGFPGVVGCIDGSHIPIRAPPVAQVSYINRKGFHSIVLQAVCNEHMAFTDSYAGEVGSVHDACVFRRSPLGQAIVSDQGLMGSRQHMLGDAAYPLSMRMMVPYKDNGHLTFEQTQYNTKHSNTRSVIERAFALLKGRFRRLKYLEMDVAHIPDAIVACTVLHNICLQNGDCDLDGIDPAAPDQPDNIANAVPSNRQIAVNKRDRIANGFVR